MGRAGGGRSGGGSRSSGGRSSSRSSGGHRVSSSRSSSSSRRAGSGSGFGGGFRSSPSRGFGHHSPPPPRHYGGYGGFHRPRTYHHTTVYAGGSRSLASTIVSIVIIIFVMIMLFSMVGGGIGSSIPASTINREKVNTGVAFQNNCIMDELGWFDNESRTSKELQYFYNKTGIQPFIYLKAYDPSLVTDDQKLEYAEQWYEENIDNEGTFLYMYFAEEDTDNDVGYMTYVNGYEITTVMDAEAVDIFWAYIDSSWYSDKSTDDLFIDAFNDTADRIMDKSTTGADVGKWAVIFIGGAVILVLVIKVMKTKRKHEKEKNEETERILNTPLSAESPTEDLVDKYTSE